MKRIYELLNKEIDKYLCLCWRYGVNYVKKNDYVAYIHGLDNIKGFGSEMMLAKQDLVKNLRKYIKDKIKQDKKFEVPDPTKILTLTCIKRFINIKRGHAHRIWKYSELLYLFRMFLNFGGINFYNNFPINWYGDVNYLKALR